jgi:hypothetical protein
MTLTLTGVSAVGLASASQAAPITPTAATSVAPVTAPGISAPPDVVVGAADGSVHLNVTLSAPGVNPVTVNYFTVNGTTSSNTYCSGSTYGYEGQHGTLTFPPGVTSQTVTVPLLNCGVSLASGFQEFSLNLSGTSSDSTMVRAATQVDVTGDASALSTPGLFVRDAVVDNSAGTVRVPVLLGGPSGAASGVAVSVPFSTHDGSAVAGKDYKATSGTLVFPAGETVENVVVAVVNRSGSALARSFSVTLGAATNATVADGTGVVTIGASGAAPVTAPGISAAADMVVGATDGYVDLPVTLSAPGVNPVTVNSFTVNGTTSANTYCSGSTYGYAGQSNSLTFEPGVTLQTVRVPLLNCGQTVKGTFSLNLSGNSSDSTVVRAGATVTVVPKVTVPGAPRTVSAVAGDGQATVSFTAPASDGGSAINAYTVKASPGGATGSGIGSPITVTGLTNGTPYTFTVTATNTRGTGPASPPSEPVTPG